MKQFKPQIRTKNFSSAPLRGSLGEFPMRAMVRLGSRTTIEEAYPRKPLGRPVIEINTVEAIENSRSKLLMKACFAEAGVPQSNWYQKVNGSLGDYDFSINGGSESIGINNLPYPILIKRVFGFKGHGMVKIDSREQLEEWIQNNPHATNWYIESYHNYSREYRCHCTKNGIFMTWRKLRRADAEERWFFNSANCNWVGEDHELFDRPSNFDQIEQDCIRALNAVGLDLGSFDVRIQSSTKANPEYILVEVNSAAALAEQGIQAYRQKLTELINEKIANYVHR